MREIKLHDTRSGGVVPLRPRDPGRVGIYACGPTVYSRIHIGNARPFVVFSLLARFLRHEGYEVAFVANVTDVNDKIYTAARPDPSSEDRARRAGCSSVQLAQEMTACYVADTEALGLGRPDREPLASETMAAIVSYVQDLIDAGHAYESGGDVFFSVRSDPQYGSLSHRRVGDADQGEGVEGVERKRDPLDFALWKARKPDEDSWWSSPWGDGRPGWHIECSAMAEQALGVGFEIHGGGSDLLFPHHENEAAQTRCARGEELARIWMHNGMIQLTGEKMAKSVGNIALLHEVIEEWGSDAVVMYLIGGHYRQPLAFGRTELSEAALRVRRVRNALTRITEGEPTPPEMAHHREAFFAALADDFNTPRALASLFEWVREANRRTEPVGGRDLREMLDVVGLGELTPLGGAGAEEVDAQAAELRDEREAARAARDFELADRLRERILELGWEVRDRAGEPAELIPRSG
ncbi:MAG TPA: cysteine--tRNA ligase [Solirubrobacteraceae bacterium]|jgi:cysteinyl-tRNA synthetase|nr:cysteine--tRNA ligase [Solirubrobacteraceae bacterium]